MQQNRNEYMRKYRHENFDKRRTLEKRLKANATARNVVFIFEYLLEHPCVDCGNCNPMVLEFDHKDRVSKKYEVSRLIVSSYSLATIKKEIEKCDVRCANCHRAKTHKEDDSNKHRLFTALLRAGGST